MIAVVQRVSEAELKIDGAAHARIGVGFVVLLGITHCDNDEDTAWLSAKIASLRIFSDEAGKMNVSLSDAGGELLLVSQFSLHASTKKGNRPSFIAAAAPETALPLYHSFIEQLTKAHGKPIKTGVFGADMKVMLVNDGPLTLIIDSKNRV